jgi:fluoroquinolone transport system ATP-binding protein
MKMRLNFCRSLLPEPELLYLDEPTSGLDPGNARVLKDLILEQKRRGTAVFLTTHDMNVAAELCNRVAFLVEGRIAAVDSPDRLMQEEGERRVVVELRRDGALDRREFELGGLARNAAFLGFLDSGEVERIHTKEANLEQVFLSLTGRSLS